MLELLKLSVNLWTWRISNKTIEKKMQDAVVVVLSYDSSTFRQKHELMGSLCKDVDVLQNFSMKHLKELRPTS